MVPQQKPHSVSGTDDQNVAISISDFFLFYKWYVMWKILIFYWINYAIDFVVYNMSALIP